MANNRIYLRCRACGRILFLGSSCNGGYSYEGYRGNKTLEERLNEFYREHTYCVQDRIQDGLYDTDNFPLPDDRGMETFGDGSFDIVYENMDSNGYEGGNDDK